MSGTAAVPTKTTKPKFSNGLHALARQLKALSHAELVTLGGLVVAANPSHQMADGDTAAAALAKAADAVTSGG